LIKGLITILLFIFNSSIIIGQVDSIINKTWCGFGGDVFKLQKDSNETISFNVNYKSEDLYFQLNEITDSNFSVTKGYSQFVEEAYVTYKYYGDSLKLFASPKLNEIFDNQNKRRLLSYNSNNWIKEDTMIFYDSLFYFKEIKFFDSLIISTGRGNIEIYNSGKIKLKFSDTEWYYNNRNGSYEGFLTKNQTEQLNSWLHLAQFQFLNKKHKGCRDGYSSNFSLFYPEVNYYTSSSCSWDVDGVSYMFMTYINNLIDKIDLKFIEYNGMSDVFFVPYFPTNNRYYNIYGKPILLDKFNNLEEKNEYFYALSPDSIFNKNDSIKTVYFFSDTLMNTSKVKFYSFLHTPIISKKLIDDYFSNFYLLNDVFWAENKNWIFKPGNYKPRFGYELPEQIKNFEKFKSKPYISIIKKVQKDKFNNK
jgi:hypothetical protein